MPRATKTQLLEARRIVVRGVTGAGKTAAAHRLADALRTPAIDSDEDIRWRDAARFGPWSARPEGEQRRLVAALAEAPAWVVAGVGAPAEELLEPRLELVIRLDYPPSLTLCRLLRRTSSRIIRRTPAAGGNRETLAEALGPDSILRWWAGSWRRHHEAADREESAPSGAPVLVLTDPRQLDLVVATVREHARGGARVGGIARDNGARSDSSRAPVPSRCRPRRRPE